MDLKDHTRSLILSMTHVIFALRLPKTITSSSPGCEDVSYAHEHFFISLKMQDNMIVRTISQKAKNVCAADKLFHGAPPTTTAGMLASFSFQLGAEPIERYVPV